MSAKVKKSPGRKRRAAAWTLLTLGLFVAGVWVASGWIYPKLLLRDGLVELAGGELVRIQVLRDTLPSGSIENFAGVRAFMREMIAAENGGSLARWHFWRLGTRTMGTTWKETTIPFWPIPLLLWTPAALLLRSASISRRRANTNACAKCGYSLAGLGADSPCPECGKRS